MVLPVMLVIICKAGGVHLSFERIKQELEEVQSSLIKDTHSGKEIYITIKA